MREYSMAKGKGVNLASKDPDDIPEKLLYNSDFSEIRTIKENKFRTLVNAICATMNLKQASLEAGIADKTMIDFCGKHDICYKKRIIMRRHFAASGVRIRLRFDYGERRRNRSSLD
jgi:hypothetical protein